MFTDTDLSLFAREALLHGLDTTSLEALRDGDDIELCLLAERVLRVRDARQRKNKRTHKLNYPIEEVLDDFTERRKGKRIEAKRQLKKRFDGQEHAMQERIMFAFMEFGSLAERNFVYDKLLDDEFWVDAYIPLVKAWWEQFGDYKLGKVVIKRCGRKYILDNWGDLQVCGDYATMCIKTGIMPNPDRMSPQTYLFVLKSIKGQLPSREGERIVLNAARDYLNKHDVHVDSIYDVPYVRRMMGYLGEMGMVEDIKAIDTFNTLMSSSPFTFS